MFGSQEKHQFRNAQSRADSAEHFIYIYTPLLRQIFNIYVINQLVLQQSHAWSEHGTYNPCRFHTSHIKGIGSKP